EQDRGGRIELVPVERRVEGGADAATAHDPKHRRLAEVDVEAIEAKSNHARHDLGLNAKIDPLQEPGAGCAYRLRLRRIHVLDVLGQELPVKPDGREGERHKAREWAEAEQLDEKDGKDHLLEAARQRQDTAAEV